MATIEPDPRGTPGPTVPLVPRRPKAGSSGGGGLLMGLAAIVAAAGIAFAVGRLTAPASATGGGGRGGNGGFGAGASFAPDGSFGPGGRGGFGGAEATIQGKVTAVGSGTITITTANGTPTTFTTTGTTTYHSQGAATPADVTVGTSVEVRVSGLGGFGRGGQNRDPGASGAPVPPSAAPSGAGPAAQDVTIVTP